VASLDARDEWLEPEVGEHLADSGQVEQRVVEGEFPGDVGAGGAGQLTRRV
jgi:hypothetical protein